MVAVVDVKMNDMADASEIHQPLSSLQRGQSGVIFTLQGDDLTTRRLLEMGFVEGARVEVLHEAPFGGDPMAVRVRGALLALRRREAHCVILSEVKG